MWALGICQLSLSSRNLDRLDWLISYDNPNPNPELCGPTRSDHRDGHLAMLSLGCAKAFCCQSLHELLQQEYLFSMILIL